MSGGRSIDKERKSPRESGEDSEDESEILEESPCGRWLKRREELNARRSIDRHIKWHDTRLLIPLRPLHISRNLQK
ncbi:hypothetical protein SFRURICE_002297 [Spodoptera frugiperda]|nr:hypothetical protein SFRURICE_002297 [Spodoptera frugiperda]